MGGMITYLGLHTDTPKGGLVYRLWACTHAGPFWWVGWDDNVPWLAHRHAERWSDLPDDNVPWLAHSGSPALGLHTCWPILVGGGGEGGMILHSSTLHYKVLLRTTKYYYKVLLQSTTPVPLFTTKYNSSTTLYSSTTPHQTLCSGCLPKFQANAAPANKSDTPTSPNNALATRSETPT